MTHKVEHSPEHFADRWTWTVLDADTSASYCIRCPTASSARRVARALDLLDIVQNATQAIQINAATFHPSLPEDEILQRAREAAAAVSATDSLLAEGYRRGKYDGPSGCVAAAARALRDLSKPLSEIVPKPVDPDLIEARKIAASILEENLDRHAAGPS